MIWESGYLQKTAVSSPPVGIFLKNDYPEVMAFTRLIANWEVLVSYSDKSLNKETLFYEDLFYIDSNLLDVFDIPLKILNHESAF